MLDRELFETPQHDVYDHDARQMESHVAKAKNGSAAANM